MTVKRPSGLTSFSWKLNSCTTVPCATATTQRDASRAAAAMTFFKKTSVLPTLCLPSSPILEEGHRRRAERTEVCMPFDLMAPTRYKCRQLDGQGASRAPPFLGPQTAGSGNETSSAEGTWGVGRPATWRASNYSSPAPPRVSLEQGTRTFG